MYQVLLTILVCVVVVIVARSRRGNRHAEPSREASPASSDRGTLFGLSIPAVLGYSLVLAMVLAAAVVFYLRWAQANRIVNIDVVSAGTSEPVRYQVLRKDIHGRQFTTLDGRQVSLGAGDRMEIIQHRATAD